VTVDRGGDRPLLELALRGGRKAWCRRYLVASTYADFDVRTPSEECNGAMLEGARAEARNLFGDRPVHVLQPARLPDEIDYPPVCVTASFTSGPVQSGMVVSDLVVVWFQGGAHPVPDKEAADALAALDWEALAADSEFF